MTPDQIKELTRQAAVAMKAAGSPIIDTEAGPQILTRRDSSGDEIYALWNPLNNAEQQLEMRRVLRINVEWLDWCEEGIWWAWHEATGEQAKYRDDNLAALMVAAEIGRSKEQS